jgi:AcrR family transcriptional regulator
MSAADDTTEAASARRPDRRARRRQETITEILDIAVNVMTEHGVNGLTLAEVARRLGVQTPSLYKYFPSINAVYDALFKQAASKNLAVLQQAMTGGEPGLDALTLGLEASGRWVLEHQALAQLLFWRPVPGFEPSSEAFAPSEEIARLQQQAIRDAVDAGQLGRDALKDAGIMVSVLIKGVLTQAMANEPHLQWGQGRFTPLFPRLMKLLPAAYPPPITRARRTQVRDRKP